MGASLHRRARVEQIYQDQILHLYVVAQTSNGSLTVQLSVLKAVIFDVQMVIMQYIKWQAWRH